MQVSNIAIMKRKVCCYRQMRNTAKAVQTLHEILTTYSADVTCWYELYENYLFCGDYPSAAFCCEEILMQDQMHSGNHSRLADVYYTLGSSGTTNPSGAAAPVSASKELATVHGSALTTGSGDISHMEYLLLARKHYTLALDRQGPAINPHGVYGLLAASKAIAARSEAEDKSHAAAVNKELLKFAQEHLGKLGLPML